MRVRAVGLRLVLRRFVGAAVTARQVPTMRDLGAFWLADNLATARADLHRCEKALASKTPGGIYAQQIEKLVAARRDVGAVWERHLEGPPNAQLAPAVEIGSKP